MGIKQNSSPVDRAWSAEMPNYNCDFRENYSVKTHSTQIGGVCTAIILRVYNYFIIMSSKLCYVGTHIQEKVYKLR